MNAESVKVVEAESPEDKTDSLEVKAVEFESMEVKSLEEKTDSLEAVEVKNELEEEKIVNG